MELLNRSISCPYCGEFIELFIDESVEESDYYEDCSVCCRPIRVQYSLDAEGDMRLNTLRDDD